MNDLDYIFVNKTLKTPIYKQISNSITHAIISGVLKYNDKLPTEKEVCRTFSISQTVVKMAYEDLIHQEMIKRIKGKGTYVTNRFIFRSQMHEFYQVDQKIKAEHMEYSYHTIMLDLIHEDITAYRMLKLEHGKPCYVILRLIKANNNPVLLQKIYLVASYFPDLHLHFNHQDRLYEIIEHQYHHELKHMHNTYSPINASSDEALLLKIQVDDAIYFVRSKLVNSKDEILGYVLNYFPGEFTELEVFVHAL